MTELLNSEYITELCLFGIAMTAIGLIAWQGLRLLFTWGDEARNHNKGVK